MRRAWDAFPTQRSYLLNSFYDDALWKLPEVFEYGRQSLMPSPESIRQTPWSGLDTIMSYSQDGKANTALERVFNAAGTGQKMEKLRADIAAHAEQNPDWQAGKVLTALIDLRLNRPVDIRAAVKPLLETSTGDYRMMQARWIVGQELEARPELRDLAIEVYQGAFENQQNSNQQFQYSPGPKLVKLYLSAGQREAARQLLVKAARESTYDNYDPSYASYLRVQTLQTIGSQLQESEFPVDALRVYRDLVIGDVDEAALSRYGRNISEVRRDAQAKIDAIIGKLTGDAGAAAVIELLAPREDAAADDAAIDLMLTTTATLDDGLPKVDSLVVRFLESADLGNDALASLRAQLDKLAAKRPQDFSVSVAQGLLTVGSADLAQTQSALDRVTALVDELPLEDLGPDQRANARQRIDAQRQVSLWLLARACLAKSDYRAVGMRLANRAVDAALRQTDPALASAMLYERGLIALDAGDRDSAEQDWSRLVESAIVNPRQQFTKRTSKTPAPPSAGQQANGGSPSNNPADKALPVTLSQFKLGAAMAHLAAEHDMPALSLRTAREIVAGGLPVPDLKPTTTTSRNGFVTIPVASTTGRSGVDQKIYDELATRMWSLSATWEKKQLPAEEVCDLLEQLVFPANRPEEVLLFEQTLGDDWSTPRSVGCLLAIWAGRAGRTETVEKQVAARHATPTDELGGHVLLAQMYLTGRDFPGVRQQLAAIEKLLDSGRLNAWAETAAHALGPAFDEAELAKDAAPLLAKAVAQVKSLASGYNNPAINSPLSKLIRYYIRSGDIAAAKTVVDAYLVRRQAEYARYGGDSPLAMQRMDFSWVANELCFGNDLQTTLDALGKVVDSASLTRSTQVSLTRAVRYLARQVEACPAAERYEKLRDWTMPAKDRRVVRSIVIVDGGQPVPDVFLSADDLPFDPRPSFAPVSNLTLLVDAAREAGKLDELWQATEPLVKDKVPGADALGILLAVARDDAEIVNKRVRSWIANYVRELALGRSRATTDWTPILVAYSALRNPRTAESGQRLLDLAEQLLKNDRTTMRSWLSYGVAQNEMRAAGQDDLFEATQLKHWVIADSARNSNALRPPAVWVAAEGHVKRLSGSELDEIFFRYPLSGKFELTADVRMGDGALCNLTYGGVGYMPSLDERVMVQSLAGNDRFYRGLRMPSSDALRENNPQWYRFSLQVADGKARFALNGWPIFEDRDCSGTSPWFGLFGMGGRQVVVRNLALRGTPTIPRAVRLVDGNRLEGWAADFGSSMQPSPTLRAAAAAEPTAPGTSPAPPATEVYDWTAEQGVLRGRLNSAQLSGAKAWLHYHRPLLSGETLRYQFLYQPGELHVHPTVGRIAYLLEPAGLRLQWLESSIRPVGLVVLDNDSIVEDPACRRAAVGELLKENDWNDVELALVGDQLTIRLNGESVCERKLDTPQDSYFGFFHRPGQTAAEIRNVELTGAWPETLAPTDLADLFAPADETLPAEARQVSSRLIGETLIADNVGSLWQSLEDLDAEARYQQLKHWVLPDSFHASYRVRSGMTDDGTRVQPALALAKLAKELDKLDDLANAVAEAAKSVPDDESSIAALEALVAIARQDAETARARLSTLGHGLSQHVQSAGGEWPHAELLAAEAAIADPPLRDEAVALADKMAGMANNQQLKRTDWQRVAGWLADRRQYGGPGDQSASAHWPLTQWHPVEHATAAARVLGHPSSAWHVADDQLPYFASGERSALYFAVPLAGDFEVRFEQPKSRQRGLAIQYAGRSFNLSGDGRLLVRQQIGLEATSNKLTAKLPKEPDWNVYRLVVRGDKFTALINDVEVASETVSAQRDPWLALVTSEFNRLGAIRRVQVIGQPSIPEEVAWTGSQSLAGWHADFYREAFNPDGPRGQNDAASQVCWTKNGDEILGTFMSGSAGTFRESLLQYHRPLLEDGVVEYEFYWDPEASQCHPAIDRQAFLLLPAGVQTHQLTDGPLDRSGSSADNHTPLEGSSPVPLKANDWNRATIQLAGNTLTITVNDQQVAQIELKPDIERTFGLFHYRDVSTARVRNVVHRGSWPRQLPPVEQQELATQPSTAEARAN